MLPTPAGATEQGPVIAMLPTPAGATEQGLHWAGDNLLPLAVACPFTPATSCHTGGPEPPFSPTWEETDYGSGQ